MPGINEALAINPPSYTSASPEEILHMLKQDGRLVYITTDVQMGEYMRHWSDIGCQCQLYALDIINDVPPAPTDSLVFALDSSYGEAFSVISAERYSFAQRIADASEALPPSCAEHFYPQPHTEVDHFQLAILQQSLILDSLHAGNTALLLRCIHSAGARYSGRVRHLCR